MFAFLLCTPRTSSVQLSGGGLEGLGVALEPRTSEVLGLGGVSEGPQGGGLGVGRCWQSWESSLH